MQIQISIKEDKAELFLQILKEFKSDMIEEYHIVGTEYVSDEEQKDIEDMLSSRTAEDKEVAFSKMVNIDI